MVEGGTFWLPPACPFEPLPYLIQSLRKENQTTDAIETTNSPNNHHTERNVNG